MGDVEVTPEARRRAHVDFAALPPIPENGASYSAEWWIAMRHLGMTVDLRRVVLILLALAFLPIVVPVYVAVLIGRFAIRRAFELRARKGEEPFLSIVAALSIIGVVVGVATVNIVLSVMEGFEVDLRDKILGANAHIVVLKYGGLIEEPDSILPKVQAIPGVTAAAPFTYSEAMARTPTSVAGIILKGLDPIRTGDITAVRDDLVLGPEGPVDTPEARAALFARMAQPCPAFPSAPPPLPPVVPEGVPGGAPAAAADEPALPCILLGADLAEQLVVGPGGKVQVIDPLGGGTGLMGIPVPRVRGFRVLAIYDSGMYEYDTKWTYVANADAQAFLEVGNAATGIELKVDDIDRVEEISDAIDLALLYPYYTRHWKELNQPLFEALELEKQVMGTILFLIVGNAALLIVTTLIMVVITKGREIAILKAMGASESAILRIFVIEGSVIGLFGTLAGTALGLLGCKFLDWYKYPLETDVYFLSHLPVVVEWQNVVVIAAAAFVICFLATLYPAWRAASLDPVEGLRYE